MARNKGLSFSKQRRKISAYAIKEVSSWVFGIVIAILLAFVMVTSIGMKISVIGVSMEPTLDNGQQIFVNRFQYNISKPDIGDVIVFLPNGNANSHYYVKRIVALPGDKVQITNGRLYVNGKMAEDGFDKIADPGNAIEEIRLADDEYFVLGDNRNNSEDSRSANIGPIKRSIIEGRAWLHMGSGKNAVGFIK